MTTTASTNADADEKRRRFESTQLRLNMLSQRRPNVSVDDYIKNLFSQPLQPKVKEDDGFADFQTAFTSCHQKANPSSQQPASQSNSLSSPFVALVQPDAPSSTDNQRSYSNTSVRWDKLSSELDGVFSTVENSATIYTTPVTGSLHTASNHQPPTWLTSPRLLPKVYQEAIKAANSSDGLDTSVITTIFRSSGLPTEVLGYIWSLSSGSYPGRLTPSELALSLALIGLAQQRPTAQLSIESVYTLSHPPIPSIVFPTVTQQSNPAGSTIQSLSTTLTTDVASSACLLEQGSANNPSTSREDWADFTTFVKHESSSVPPKNADGWEITSQPSFDKVNPSRTALESEDDFGEFQAFTSSPPSNLPSTTTHGIDPNLSVGVAIKPSIEVKIPVDYSALEGLESVPKTMALQQDWLRCLSQCFAVLSESTNVLSDVTSEAHIKEFASTQKGNDFFLDVLEVYLVGQRINTSARFYGLLEPALSQKMADIESRFQALTVFAANDLLRQSVERIAGWAVESRNKHTSELMPDGDVSARVCGVCLTPVGDSNDQTGGCWLTEAGKYVIDMAGRSYHAPCANFWVNRVELSLPALNPP